MVTRANAKLEEYNDKKFWEAGQFYRAVWKSEHGPQVFLHPSFREESVLAVHGVYDEPETHVVLIGSFSNMSLPKALRYVEEKFLPILDVVADSSMLSERRVDSSPTFKLSLPESFFEHTNFESDSHFTDVFHTSLAYLYSPDAQVMIHELMRLGEIPGKCAGELDSRLVNAFNLLCIEPKVQSNGIGLSLSVSAIESLLVGKGDGPSSVFRDLIPALMVPDPEVRKSVRKDLENLYEWRYETVHGRGIDCPRAYRIAARRLACGVLRAVFSPADCHDIPDIHARVLATCCCPMVTRHDLHQIKESM